MIQKNVGRVNREEVGVAYVTLIITRKKNNS